MTWYAPWNKQAPTSQPSEPAPSEVQEPTEHEPDSLSARVSLLAADLSALQLEWAEVLDKLNRWAKRQSARDRRAVHGQLDGLIADGPEVAEDDPGATNGQEPGNGAHQDRSAAKAALRARIRR